MALGGTWWQVVSAPAASVAEGGTVVAGRVGGCVSRLCLLAARWCCCLSPLCDYSPATDTAAMPVAPTMVMAAGASTVGGARDAAARC